MKTKFQKTKRKTKKNIPENNNPENLTRNDLNNKNQLYTFKQTNNSNNPENEIPIKNQDINDNNIKDMNQNNMNDLNPDETNKKIINNSNDNEYDNNKIPFEKMKENNIEKNNENNLQNLENQKIELETNDKNLKSKSPSEKNRNITLLNPYSRLLLNRTEPMKKASKKTINFEEGNCWACDIGCSISTTGYSPMTFSPYINTIKRRDVTPIKSSIRYEQYTRHKKNPLN